MYRIPSVSILSGQFLQAHDSGCSMFAADRISLDVPSHAPVLCIIETPFGEVLGMAQRLPSENYAVIVGPAIAHPEWITIPQADKIARQLWDDMVDYVYLSRSTLIESVKGSVVRTDVLPIENFGKVLRTEEWHERHPIDETMPAALLSQYLMAAFRHAGVGGAYTCGEGIQPS